MWPRIKGCESKHGSEMNFMIGDTVWLFNPAVKVGQINKFCSLWRGPYTVIERVSPLNYRIQLFGSTCTSTQIVHHDRLKLCHGDTERCTMSRGSENTNQPERDEVLPSVELWIRICADADNETGTPEQLVHHRQQRDHHPPLRYEQHPGI